VEGVLVPEGSPECGLGAAYLGAEFVGPLRFGGQRSVEGAECVLEADDQAGGRVLGVADGHLDAVDGCADNVDQGVGLVVAVLALSGEREAA
jgi:hypothetical protein